MHLNFDGVKLWGSIPKETVSNFVETEKTDIRYFISYFGQSRFFGAGGADIFLD